MTTSGTVGSTVIDVTTFIEHAIRRCGVSASIMTAEQNLSAKENLFLMLMDLANRGVNLWCVQKYPLTVTANQKILMLPVGTVDLLRANYRQVQQPASTPITGSGIIGADYGTGNAVAVMTVGITPGVLGTFNFVVESSPDGVTWTIRQVLPVSLSMVAGTQTWYDVDNSASTEFWRLRETAAQSLASFAVTFGSTPTEIPMAKLNRDSYTTLPNKDFTSAKPLQYWFDKQAYQPRMWLWPVPNDPTIQVVAWTHRHIQDVGALTNTLDLPTRWYQATLYMLAFLIAMEIPTVDKDRRVELKALADEHLSRAEDGERDGAPIRWAPNIRCYTK